MRLLGDLERDLLLDLPDGAVRDELLIRVLPSERRGGVRREAGWGVGGDPGSIGERPSGGGGRGGSGAGGLSGDGASHVKSAEELQISLG